MDIITVAIIEDLDDIREALRLLINGSDGFNCEHVYRNASDAINELPDLIPDVVLVDINMPGMSGIDCVRILKNKIPKTQFMIETIYSDDDTIFNAINAGATGYILKKTSPSQILESIRELYNGGSPMSAEVARRVVTSLQRKTSNSEEILTDREKEVLKMLAKGFIYKEIATKLDIGYETVKKHIQNIYSKLHVQNKIEAVNKIFLK